MHPNRSSRRVHSAQFKAQVLSECRQPGASVSAVAIAHGLNTNVVRKWLAGRNLKRMGLNTPSPGCPSGQAATALQFVPLNLSEAHLPASMQSVRPEIRIELERGGLSIKLHCSSAAAAAYAAQLRAMADALCAG